MIRIQTKKPNTIKWDDIKCGSWFAIHKEGSTFFNSDSIFIYQKQSNNFCTLFQILSGGKSIRLLLIMDSENWFNGIGRDEAFDPRLITIEKLAIDITIRDL